MKFDIAKSVSRFPFGVHYKLEENKIIILGVFHTSRSPKHWEIRQ